MNNTETIVIKIGTAALTTPTGEPDEKVLRSVVNQIADLKDQGHVVYLVTSGAVGTGRSLLTNGEIPKSFDETLTKQHQAAIGQPDLMQIYERLFGERNLKREQVLLERAHFGPDGDDIKSSFKRTMGKLCGFPELQPNQHAMRLLKSFKQMPHVVPIINENDTTAIAELMFTDNDDLAGRVAKLVKADHFILVTNIDGIYNKDPKTYSDTKLIQHHDYAGGPLPVDTNGKSNSGRGGATSKVATAERAAAEGIIVHVVNSRNSDGTPSDAITRVMAGEPVGTKLVHSAASARRPQEDAFVAGLKQGCLPPFA